MGWGVERIIRVTTLRIGVINPANVNAWPYILFQCVLYGNITACTSLYILDVSLLMINKAALNVV